MTELGSHPAVFAGLLGSAQASQSKIVQLSPLEELGDAIAGSLLLQFVVGCLAGAAIAGSIAFVADRISKSKDERDDANQDADDFWSSSSLNLVRTQVEEDNDPTGDLGRFRTGQITIDIPVLNVTKQASEKRRPRHSASIASAHVVAQSPAKHAGRHFASSAKQSAPVQDHKPETAASERRGRHFSGAVKHTATSQKHVHAPAEAQVSYAAPAVEPVANPVVPVVTHSASSQTQQVHERLAQLPVIESRYAKPAPGSYVSSRAVSPSDTFSFLDNPRAERPVKASPTTQERESASGITGKLRQRIAERRKSVREVLADRLGGSALDGVPRIPRADGTVSEISTSWFDDKLVPALASLTGAHGKLDDTAEREVMPAQRVNTSEVPSRSTYISRHVAEVDEGMFPERRSIDDLKHEDVWEQALEAMGETIARDTPGGFQDVVGGPTTIDDPDGLEASTGFIPFRVPAAHPEVVDTETYVDYLLRDELSHNSSEVLRQSSHAHLRVIEGGTSPLRINRREAESSAPKPAKRGRHFAPTRYAAEA